MTADLYRDRLTAMALKWEAAATAGETEADTFANGYLSGQNLAASELRELLWQIECAEHAAEPQPTEPRSGWHIVSREESMRYLGLIDDEVSA